MTKLNAKCPWNVKPPDFLIAMSLIGPFKLSEVLSALAYTMLDVITSEWRARKTMYSKLKESPECPNLIDWYAMDGCMPLFQNHLPSFPWMAIILRRGGACTRPGLCCHCVSAARVRALERWHDTLPFARCISNIALASCKTFIDVLALGWIAICVVKQGLVNA